MSSSNNPDPPKNNLIEKQVKAAAPIKPVKKIKLSS